MFPRVARKESGAATRAQRGSCHRTPRRRPFAPPSNRCAGMKNTVLKQVALGVFFTTRLHGHERPLVKTECPVAGCRMTPSPLLAVFSDEWIIALECLTVRRHELWIVAEFAPIDRSVKTHHSATKRDGRFDTAGQYSNIATRRERPWSNCDKKFKL